MALEKYLAKKKAKKELAHMGEGNILDHKPNKEARAIDPDEDTEYEDEKPLRLSEKMDKDVRKKRPYLD